MSVGGMPHTITEEAGSQGAPPFGVTLLEGMASLVAVKEEINEKLHAISSLPGPGYDASHFCSQSIGLTTKALEDVAELMERLRHVTVSQLCKKKITIPTMKGFSEN